MWLTYALGEINKHKWYFVSSIGLFLFIGIIYIKNTPASYTASTEIGLKNTASSPLSRQVQQLNSTLLVEKAIWHTRLTPKTLAPESSEVIRQGLALKIPYPDSSLIILSLTLDDELYAKNLLYTLRKLYQVDSGEVNKAKLALAANNKKLDSLSKQGSEIEEQQAASKADLSSSNQPDILSTEEKEILKKQLAVYKVIRSYVHIPYTQFSIIPTTFDVENSALEQMVKQINNSQIDRQKLLQQQPKNGVALEEINKTIHQLKDNALLKLDSMSAAANARLLGKVTDTAPDNTPKAAIVPQQQSNRRLYANLLSKRKVLENVIRSHNNVADSPVTVVKNDKPVLLVIFLSLISGVLFSIIIFYGIKIFGQLTLAEIQKKSKVPVLGMVSNYKNTEAPVGYNGAFGLQLNGIVESLMKHSKSNVLIFTSLLPGEGKSFISANFALMMAGTGKSVLLIRYKQDRKNITSTPTPLIKKLSAYITDDDNGSFKDIIYKTDITGLSVIDLTGVDPLKYLNNTWMNSLIDHASVNYDLVLIDSNFIPPAKFILTTDNTELNFINILSTKLKNRKNLNILNSLFITRNQTNLYLVVNNFD